MLLLLQKVQDETVKLIGKKAQNGLSATCTVIVPKAVRMKGWMRDVR
jgi:hypothetical protein